MILNFTVLLSLYKKENAEYLAKSLDSIFNQTLPPSEVVLVKDGELTSELEVVIEQFSREYKELKVIDIPVNVGLAKALNEGLQNCTFDIVARMDTDDICFSNRFEEQLNYMKDNPEVDILGSYAIRIDENGREIDLLKVPNKHSDICRLVWASPFIHPSVIFKKNKIIGIGNYNPNSGVRQDDYELWFRCVENNLICANMDRPLIYYRHFSDNVKRNNVRVGIDRFKVGYSGCQKLHLPIIAYIGITFPLIRSLLPYPLNYYFNNLMLKLNPRTKM